MMRKKKLPPLILFPHGTLILLRSNRPPSPTRTDNKEMAPPPRGRPVLNFPVTEKKSQIPDFHSITLMRSRSVVNIPSRVTFAASRWKGGQYISTFTHRATIFRMNQVNEVIPPRTRTRPTSATLGQFNNEEKVKAPGCITIPPALKSRSTINSLHICRRLPLPPGTRHSFHERHLFIYLFS